MRAIIETKELSKKFGSLTAFDSVTLTVNEGEIFGLIGANGAGKTTTIMTLSALLFPTSGAAFICGHDILRARDEVRKCIGVVFEEPSMDIRLTGYENLDSGACESVWSVQ